MRSKAHTTPAAPLVLHPRRSEKNATKKFIINGQSRNELFLIVINRFSLVKVAMNVRRVCQLFKNFLTIIDQCATHNNTEQHTTEIQHSCT
jgi:hypothetical protein